MLLSNFFLFLIAEFYWAYRVAVDFWIVIAVIYEFIPWNFINFQFLMSHVHCRYGFCCHVIKFNGRCLWNSKITILSSVSIGFLSEWEQNLHVLNFTILRDFTRETLTDFYHQKVNFSIKIILQTFLSIK